MSAVEFERPIPPAPWRGIAVVVTDRCHRCDRGLGNLLPLVGYGPTLNDTEDLWVQARRRVQPESVVIVGDSRARVRSRPR